MNVPTLIFKNAVRNKRRALLTVLSVAISLGLFVVLLIALREMTLPPEDINSALRVVVRNKISLATLLPARQRTALERIPGVEAVTPFTWYGGKYKDEYGVPFAQFGMDPDKLLQIFSEVKVPRDQFEAFRKDMRGCLVGKDTAEKYKIKIGDRMNFIGQIWPADLEFIVAGIYQGTLDDRNLLFHHKYLEEATGSRGDVGTWWVKVRSAEVLPAVLEDINRTFANSAAPVRAETERAFQLSFISMVGNIKVLVGAICSVVVMTLLVVSASTMSMAVRERFRELAILKAIGFRRRELFAFILAESFGLAMAGATLGILGAWVVASNAYVLTQGVFSIFELTPRIVGLALAVAAGLGVASSLLPSLAVARSSVVEGLRTLD